MSEISRLKRQGRELLRRIHAAQNGADCGNALLEHISSSFAADRAELDAIMTRLRQIDPQAPQ